MTKTPRLLLVAGVLALTGLAPVTVGHAEPQTHAGTVTAVEGPVTVTRLSAAPQPLKFRDALFWRDVVESRKDGIARVLLAGKTTVTVREFSRLELREEAMAEGTRYTAELISGKVRASVARMLMRPGDQVEIRTKNAVASVRGTDFIVETTERPTHAGAFGLLGVRAVAQAVADGGSQPGETVVVTLSGAVDVTNRLSGTGRVEHVRASEAVRVSGRQDPLRFQVRTDDLRLLLQGLTPPRPQEARSGDKSEAVGTKIELAALATSAKSLRASGQAGGHDQQNGQANGRSHSQSSQAGGTGGGQGSSAGSGQGSTPGTQATPAVPATPATPAVAATPAVPASPATPAMPAAPAAANHGGGHGASRGNSPGQGRR